MDAVTTAVEKVKGLAKSSQDVVTALVRRRRRRPYSRNPASKGSPFQEARTHVRGEIDVLGAILMMRDLDQQHFDALDRAGIRIGTNSRIIFESTVRQKDTLVAQFKASQMGNKNLGDVLGSPLSLAKLFYVANGSDWFSATAMPVGAQCRDFDTSNDSSGWVQSIVHIDFLEYGLTYFSLFEPPLLSQNNGGAIDLTVRKSNVVASLAQSFSGMEMQLGSGEIGHCFSTLGKIVCQLPRGVKLSLMGLHQVPKLLNHHFNLGFLALPVGFFKQHKASERMIEATTPSLGINTQELLSTGSIALKLESKLDESTKIRGWIEMQNSNNNHLRWAVTMFDNSKDEFGWGVSLSEIDGLKRWEQYQFESFATLCLGKRFNLKLGVAYVVDGDAKILALMFRCNWSL